MYYIYIFYSSFVSFPYMYPDPSQSNTNMYSSTHSELPITALILESHILDKNKIFVSSLNVLCVFYTHTYHVHFVIDSIYILGEEFRKNSVNVCCHIYILILFAHFQILLRIYPIHIHLPMTPE